MRLRSPAENYIKYLVVHPDAFTTDDIRERLLDEGLDFISNAYIDKLRTKLKPPKPFFPNKRTHAASLNFILRERINGMFQRNDLINRAIELLNTPRAKEFVEAMILVHVPRSAIAAFVTQHRGVYCTPSVLELYEHYFWNINLLDTTQMRVLLELRVDTAVANTPELAGKTALLKHAYFKDARKVAADLPYSPTTAMLAQMRLGIKPGKSELALRMLEARDAATIRAIEAAQQDGPGDSQKFLNYITGSKILQELIEMVVKPEEEMREQLASIALRTDTREIPSIHKLSGGSHTVDVAPTKDLQNVDAPDFEPQAGAEDHRDG